MRSTAVQPFERNATENDQETNAARKSLRISVSLCPCVKLLLTIIVNAEAAGDTEITEKKKTKDLIFMSESQLIDAVKIGELAKVEELLNSGADIHQQDEQGWTPLNWAAGRGDLDMVKLLLDRGADVFRVGRDQRTPYKISLAARHTDVARLLKEKEQGSNGTSSDSSPRDYAKGYLLGDLRKFSGWHEENGNSRRAFG